jgi:tRNA G18 (ribose-2'-O)-methylase SpoU
MATHEPLGEHCPACGAVTLVAYTLAPPAEAPHTGELAPPPSNLAALLDNVRSLFNVGSIFRSADGAGLEHLFLCGVTPTPQNRKLVKTALGAEQHVGWSQHNNAVELAVSLLAQGRRLWALEASSNATSIFAAPPLDSPTVLVIGNEVTGIDPDLLALCSCTLAIPMYGRKRSLNVATAFGVAAVVIRRPEDNQLRA